MAFSFRPLPSAGRDDMMLLRRGVVRVRFRQDNFYLRHRDHRQIANEEEKEREEDAEGADERPNIDPGGNEQAPRRREKVTVQSADDNDETLEPHAGVHAHADEIHDIDVAPEAPEPEELWRKHVAEKHAHPP